MLSNRAALLMLKDAGLLTSALDDVPEEYVVNLYKHELVKLTNVMTVFVPRMTVFLDLCQEEYVLLSEAKKAQFTEEFEREKGSPVSQSYGAALDALIRLSGSLSIAIHHVKIRILQSEYRNRQRVSPYTYNNEDAITIFQQEHPFLQSTDDRYVEDEISDAIDRIAIYVEESLNVSSEIDDHTKMAYDEIWAELLEPYFALKGFLEKQIPGYHEEVTI